jgi:hypothetical protein
MHIDVLGRSRHRSGSARNRVTNLGDGSEKSANMEDYSHRKRNFDTKLNGRWQTIQQLGSFLVARAVCLPLSGGDRRPRGIGGGA